MSECYTCILVDDEKLAIERLVYHLKEVHTNIKVIGTYTSWAKALEVLNTTVCDILILDISMQGNNGMDLIRLVPQMTAEVIFVTAHADYALDAYRLFAAAYLLKPFDKVELSQAINKVVKRIHDNRLANEYQNDTTSRSRKIAVPEGHTVSYVDTERIVYLEAVSGYTKIIQEGNIERIYSFSIGKFTKQLPQHFYQIHRSYIVNLNYVLKYDNKGILTMTNMAEIPVAKTQREAFQKLFNRIHK